MNPDVPSVNSENRIRFEITCASCGFVIHVYHALWKPTKLIMTGEYGNVHDPLAISRSVLLQGKITASDYKVQDSLLQGKIKQRFYYRKNYFLSSL